MMNPRVTKLLVTCILLSSGIASAKSRAMSPQQYAGFLNRLDQAVTTWRDQIKNLDTIKLPVDDDKRKQLAMKGALANAILDQIRSKISPERERPSLALEIVMSDTFTTASLLLKDIADQAPEGPARKQWSEAIGAIQNEISDYARPLHEHVIDKAYDLEYELEDCQALQKTAK